MAGEPGHISEKVRKVLASPEAELWISAISAFEISLKVKKGKLDLPLPPRTWFKEAVKTYNLREISITSEIAGLAPEVAVPHADPCDRFIVAAAQIHGLAVATPDPMIHACQDIEVIW